VVTVPDIPTLTADLAVASAAGIKLVVGLWPPPYTLNSDNATWTISALGNTFLQNLAANSSSVLGVYVFNEPYYTGSGNSQNACGVYSAAQLAQLRTQIQAVWGGAKIYQDIGDPTAWIPGGSVWQSCVGNKYAVQTNVADYVGIWYYPFSSANAYGSAAVTTFVNRVAPYVKNSMSPAVPVFLAQSFAAGSGSAGDGSSAIMPTAANMKSLNCTLRTLLPTGSMISWYVWIQAGYTDYLKNHSELWPDAPASACGTSMTPQRSARPAKKNGSSKQ
jgi:hypothetical protein